MPVFRRLTLSLRQQKVRLLCLFFLLLSLSLLSGGSAAVRASTTQKPGYHAQVLWDTWGVPHIYAPSTPDLFYAFGWAQMRSHANLLLHLYGEARGRAAEYWGADYLNSDETVRLFSLPDKAQEWYAQQSPSFRSYLDAFVAGINAYALQHPDQISQDARVVLPVKVTDVTAHLQNILLHFLMGSCGVRFPDPIQAAGSNGWAIAPSHTAGGRTMLLANPHLNWSLAGQQGVLPQLTTFYEAQLVGPDVDAYGAALVGLPVLSIAFNHFLSWTHTVNTLDGCDIYRLTASNDGYLYDGQTTAFSSQTQTILIKQSDGSFKSVSFVVRRSIQGPVLQVGGTSYAIRMVGIDQFPVYGALQEWWSMARAHTMSGFQAALSTLQLPMFTVIYADRAGNIFSLFNGEVPQRPQGDWRYWSSIVPGDTSSTLWTNILPYQDLPAVVDPASGWVENSNSSPWYTTLPQQIFPQDYPAYLAPQSLNLREQRGIEMLMANPHMTFQDLIQDKFSAHEELADRLLPDLIAAARASGNDLANQAADVLAAWDRSTNAESKGAVLFNAWVSNMGKSSGGLFATPWDPAQPLTTPAGLADAQSAVSVLEATASQVQSLYGALDVPWGSVYRLQLGSADYPASGGGVDGVFRALGFVPSATSPNQWQAVFGDTYIAAVEFSPRGVDAQVLLTYGNASQPGSKHISDQLSLYAQSRLRTAWFTPIEVLAHLELQETL